MPHMHKLPKRPTGIKEIPWTTGFIWAHVWVSEAYWNHFLSIKFFPENFKLFSSLSSCRVEDCTERYRCSLPKGMFFTIFLVLFYFFLLWFTKSMYQLLNMNDPKHDFFIGGESYCWSSLWTDGSDGFSMWSSK